MNDKSWRPSAILPLLLELARALRARRFYLPDDPAQHKILQRTASIWSAAFKRAGTLRLLVGEQSFHCPDGPAVGGPGVRELASALHALRVQQIVVLSGLSAREVIQLVTVLAHAVDSAAPPGPFSAKLAEADVTRIRLDDGDGKEGLPTEPVSPRGSQTVSTEIQGTSEEPSEAAQVDRLLGELERSARAPDYERVSRELESVLRARMQEKDYVDAYRAALVFGRHGSGVGAKLPEVQSRACETLHRLLLDNEELLRIAVQRAYIPDSGSMVEAIQLLAVLGTEIVPRLLEEHSRGTPEAQERTPSILVALADSALPVLIEELASDSPARVRRAARLLGDMQHPRAEGPLSELLRSPEDAMRREAARALGHLGSPRAIGRLSEALHGVIESAEAAAYGLGWCSGPVAMRALSTAVLDETRGREPVRREAALALGRIGNLEGLTALDRVLQGGKWLKRKKLRPVRLAAVEALARIGGDRARALLRELGADPDAAVREAGAKALESMAPHPAEASDTTRN